MLEGTDLLLTCPQSLAESYARMAALAVSDLPVPLPSINTRMVWHEKYQQDPFHIWLREALSEHGG